MRTFYFKILYALLLFLGSLSNLYGAEKVDNSMLSGFSLGLGGSLITNEYKDMQGNSTLLPLLGYESEYFYLRGVAGGIHFFRNDWLELNAQLSYLPQHFYAGDSGNWAMRQLDNRYSTLMGGFNGRITSEIGIISATLSTDLLGYSNGTLLDAAYTYPIAIERLNIAPTIGFQWNDTNYNKYYYGIENSEARRSGLETYNPESSCSPYAQLSARLNFNENWSALASMRAMFLNQEIYDSPMVEKSEKYSFSLGALYSF